MVCGDHIMEPEGKNEEKLDFTHIIVHQEEIGYQTALKVVKRTESGER